MLTSATTASAHADIGNAYSVFSKGTFPEVSISPISPPFPPPFHQVTRGLIATLAELHRLHNTLCYEYNDV